MKNYITLPLNELVTKAIANGIFVSDNKSHIHELLMEEANLSNLHIMSDDVDMLLNDIYKNCNTMMLVGLCKNGIDIDLQILARMKTQWSENVYKRIYAVKNVNGNVKIYDVSDIINAYAAIINYQISTMKQSFF